MGKYCQRENLHFSMVLDGSAISANIFRFFIIVSPRIRAYLLYIRYRLIKKECINIIVKQTKMGDWFLLYMLGQNIDAVVFKEVVHELAKKLGYHNKEDY